MPTSILRPIAWVLLVGLAPSLLRAETQAPPQTAVPAQATFFEKVLKLNLVQEPELDAEAARRAFAGLLERLKPAIAAAQTPREKIAVLNRMLLADREVAYLSNLYWRDATLAASLLRGKGNCLSTSTLYVLAGRELNLPIKMVLIPRHAFVRWDDGRTKINIETTNKGKEIPEAEYLRMSDQPTPEDIEALGWFKSLDDDAFFAEMLTIAAGHRIGEAKLEEAAALLDEALRLAPGRTDYELQRYKLMADMTGRRSEARAKIVNLLQAKRLPPGVATAALSYLASDAAGQGDHLKERHFLMLAFKEAPKNQQPGILTQLAFCHRALKDFRGAVRYMELAAAIHDPNDPNFASFLYNLAILQKNDQRLGDALASIRKARQINPESWNLQTIEAGYLVLNGQRDEGLKLFAAVKEPRADKEFYEIMVSWFYAVSRQREKFYAAFETALKNTRGTHILEWIDQDVDLDVYRNEPEFKTLVETHRKRLVGK
ncbi:MAG: hypothetical protein M5U26_10630 [Planctomycetota bacterium]|nr:hypothetical protein [Planctomycetota bacterium]